MIKYIAAIFIAFQIAVSGASLKQNNSQINNTNKTGSNGNGNSFSQAVDKDKVEDSHKDGNKEDNKDNKDDNKDNKDDSPNKNVKTEGNSNAFGTAVKASNQKSRSFVVRSK